MYFVMLSNTFREHTCKHDSKRKSYEAVRDGSIVLCFERPTSRKSAKSNRKTRCFQRSRSSDKLSRSRVCCDVWGRKFQWVEWMSANVLQTAWVHWWVPVLLYIKGFNITLLELLLLPFFKGRPFVISQLSRMFWITDELHMKLPLHWSFPLYSNLPLFHCSIIRITTVSTRFENRKNLAFQWLLMQ